MMMGQSPLAQALPAANCDRPAWDLRGNRSSIAGGCTVAILASTAVCGAGTAPAPSDVIVFVVDRVHVPGPILPRAIWIASRTFDGMGIRMVFRDGEFRPDRQHAASYCIQARIEDTPFGDRRAGVAYSTPFAVSDVLIGIRYDRVRALGQPPRGLEPYLLAGVLQHEIAHVLQGSGEHTASGMIKGHWSRAECSAIQQTPLAFRAADIEKDPYRSRPPFGAEGGRASGGFRRTRE